MRLLLTACRGGPAGGGLLEGLRAGRDGACTSRRDASSAPPPMSPSVACLPIPPQHPQSRPHTRISFAALWSESSACCQIGAPLGSWLASYCHRLVLAWFVYLATAASLIAAVLIVLVFGAMLGHRFGPIATAAERSARDQRTK